MMHDHGQSDSPVVPTKVPNKAGEPAAEGMEGRGLAKGNPRQHTAPRAQDRVGALSALERVRQVAKRDKQVRFTTLLHHAYHIDQRRRGSMGRHGGTTGRPSRRTSGTSRDGWREGRIERGRSSGRTSPRPTGG